LFHSPLSRPNSRLYPQVDMILAAHTSATLTHARPLFTLAEWASLVRKQILCYTCGEVMWLAGSECTLCGVRFNTAGCRGGLILSTVAMHAAAQLLTPAERSELSPELRFTRSRNEAEVTAVSAEAAQPQRGLGHTMLQLHAYQELLGFLRKGGRCSG
jgi:hypothetical protein